MAKVKKLKALKETIRKIAFNVLFFGIGFIVLSLLSLLHARAVDLILVVILLALFVIPLAGAIYTKSYELLYLAFSFMMPVSFSIFVQSSLHNFINLDTWQIYSEARITASIISLSTLFYALRFKSGEVIILKNPFWERVTVVALCLMPIFLLSPIAAYRDLVSDVKIYNNRCVIDSDFSSTRPWNPYRYYVYLSDDPQGLVPRYQISEDFYYKLAGKCSSDNSDILYLPYSKYAFEN